MILPARCRKTTVLFNSVFFQLKLRRNYVSRAQTHKILLETKTTLLPQLTGNVVLQMKFVKLFLISLGRLALCFDEQAYIQSLREKFAAPEKGSLFKPENFFSQQVEETVLTGSEEPSLFVGKFTTASIDELVKTVCSKFPEIRADEIIPKSYKHVDFYMLISVAETSGAAKQ
ncbi:LAQU0S02e03026g1_1 [Lachancea quebecensis]|uniref:LAQU0S02e03026g1_1 n=1 Tax=Lachancea quebecensis TaxID=1654605 RepID=A0A0P1KQB9_9SACH|nr:LAQU0S02e03026g1_1 [Lachancea quebecensis]